MCQSRTSHTVTDLGGQMLWPNKVVVAAAMVMTRFAGRVAGG